MKSSSGLRKSENLISISQQFSLKSLKYLTNYIHGEKAAFSKSLKLPSAKYHINKRTRKIIFEDHRSSAFLGKSFFHSTAMKWNSLPTNIRAKFLNPVKLKSILHEHYLKQNIENAPSFSKCTWKEFRFIG